MKQRNRLLAIPMLLGLTASLANAAVYSVDVVRNGGPIGVSGNVAGSPFAGQTGPWNAFNGNTRVALTNLTDGAGGTSTVGLSAMFSGTTGFQASGNSAPAVLAADNPERLWVTGTGSMLTLVFSGLSIGGAYDLAIFNTGSAKGTITINGGTTHTGVSTIFTSSEVADGSGKITAVVGFVGGAHTDYMEVSGLQLQTIPEPSALALLGLTGLGLIRRRRN